MYTTNKAFHLHMEHNQSYKVAQHLRNLCVAAVVPSDNHQRFPRWASFIWFQPNEPLCIPCSLKNRKKGLKGEPPVYCSLRSKILRECMTMVGGSCAAADAVLYSQPFRPLFNHQNFNHHLTSKEKHQSAKRMLEETRWASNLRRRFVGNIAKWPA